MINSINDVNTLQITNAINAFKNTVRPIIKEEFQEENSALDSSIDIQAGKQKKEDFSNIGLLKSEPRVTAQTQNYINEVKNFAGQIGISDLSDEEITYAMKYGRSLLADYTA